MQQTAIFVQHMRSCSAPESVHQTQVFSVLLAFLSLVLAGPIASGRRGRPTRLSGRNFGSLIVQQTRGSLAEPFKCKRQGAWRTIAGYEAVHMIRKGQACWSAVGAKVGLLHRFIVGMFGLEV
jgi:hypothetical protein